MHSVSIRSSKERPSRVGELLDQRGGLLFGVLLVGVVATIGISLVAGFRYHEHPGIFVNTDVFVATAGLFVGALAVERLTEILIAPWVGRGTRPADRAVRIGVGSLLIGTIVAAVLGLRIVELVRGVVVEPDDWGKLAVSTDVLATGLAIGAGGKPLHDLISRFEKRVDSAKAGSLGVDLKALGSGPHRISLSIERRSAHVDLESTLRKVLPGWTVMVHDDKNSALVGHRTSSTPDSSEYIHHRFAAAHRLHAAGLIVRSDMPVGEGGEPNVDPRASLALLGAGRDTAKQAGHGENVIVAVLDTGVNDHSDGVPESQRLEGFDTIDDKPGATDPLEKLPGLWHGDLLAAPGHGTAVAGVIAAPGRPDEDGGPAWDSPMLGVAPRATIAPYRVMTGQAHLHDKDVAVGVARAVDADCDVINMSLGGYGFDGLRDATAAAVDAGIIVVCAAGNLFGQVVDPAAFPHTIGVSSTRPDGEPFAAGASNGQEVLVSAPGVEVRRPSFDRANGSETLKAGTGTTYAAAHVSGLAALWLSKHDKAKLRAAYPGRQLTQAFALVLTTTATPWSDADLADNWGAGAVNAEKALAVKVLDGRGAPTLSRDQLDAALPLAADLSTGRTESTIDRIAAGVARALGREGAHNLRDKAVNGLSTLIGRIPGVTAPEGLRDAVDPVQAKRLIAAELAAHAKIDDTLRVSLKERDEPIPVPENATQELRTVIGGYNDAVARGSVVDGNFLVGTSAGLRRALRG